MIYTDTRNLQSSVTMAPAGAGAAALPRDRVPASSAANATRAPLTYVDSRAEAPVVIVPPAGHGDVERTGRYREVDVTIHDGRHSGEAYHLDTHGFEMVPHDTALPYFTDDDAIRRWYYPEMTNLLATATGALRVVVFDHNVRRAAAPGSEDGQTRRPVRNVHNDYTLTSAPRRARQVLEGEAALLDGRRFALINVWRPIIGPVETAPLALLDARSYAPEDLVKTELRYPGRTGEIYELAHNDRHHWVTFPAMEADEALLIKGYDSLDDGRALLAPHTAFDDPASPPGAAARYSIEVRALAIYGLVDDR